MSRTHTITLYKFDELEEDKQNTVIETFKQSVLYAIKELKQFRDVLILKILGCKNTDGSYNLNKLSEYRSHFLFGKDVNQDIDTNGIGFIKDIIRKGDANPSIPFETQIETLYNNLVNDYKIAINPPHLEYNVNTPEYFNNGVAFEEYIDDDDDDDDMIVHMVGDRHRVLASYAEKLPEE